MAHYDIDQLWDQVNDQIRAKIGNERVQLVYPPIAWNFPYTTAGHINEEVYNLVDRIPSYSKVGQYSATAKSLYNQYCNVIKNCPDLIPTIEEQRQMQEIDDLIKKSEEKIQAIEERMEIAWAQHKRFASDTSESARKEWEIKNGWKKQMDTAQKELGTYNDTKEFTLKQQIASQSEEKIKAAELPPDVKTIKPGFAYCAGTKQCVANYIIKDDKDWVTELVAGGGGQPLTISIDTASSSESKDDFWAGAHADYHALGLPFLCLVDAEGKATDKQLHTKSDKLKIEITLKAFTQAPIRPDSWYDSGHLGNLKIRNHWKPPYTLDDVFGKKGMLPLMITGLIAGYQPSFRITNESSQMNIEESLFDGRVELQLGPFRFGGGGQENTSKIKVSRDGKTIEGTSTAKYPFIMGFTVANPVDY